MHHKSQTKKTSFLNNSLSTLTLHSPRLMSNSKGFTAFVVDDNPSALQTLANDLSSLPEFSSVHTFQSYTEATLPLIELQPDVLFLDVEVPGKSGLEFLDSIRPKVNFSFRVVFYTAFSDYMINAIRLSALDYLLKPYKRSKLRIVVDRLVQDANEKGTMKRLALDETPHKMAMQTVSELLLVTVEEVLLFTYNSSQRSWQLTLTDRSTHLLKRGVTAEDLIALHSAFVRISNTCIVNLTYLAAVENNTQRCRLCPPFDDFDIMVSRRYFSKLKEIFELL